MDNRQVFPIEIVANMKHITNIESTAINFNKFFNKVCPNLAQKTISSNKHFNDYMTSCDIFQPAKEVQRGIIRFLKNKQKRRV